MFLLKDMTVLSFEATGNQNHNTLFVYLFNVLNVQNVRHELVNMYLFEAKNYS